MKRGAYRANPFAPGKSPPGYEFFRSIPERTAAKEWRPTTSHPNDSAGHIAARVPRRNGAPLRKARYMPPARKRLRGTSAPARWRIRDLQRAAKGKFQPAAPQRSTESRHEREIRTPARATKLPPQTC